jgi:hypothetical protein
MGGLDLVSVVVPIDGASAHGQSDGKGAIAGRRSTGTHRAVNQSDPEGIDHDAENGATKKQQPEKGADMPPGGIPSSGTRTTDFRSAWRPFQEPLGL